jgi:hypothetical protein
MKLNQIFKSLIIATALFTILPATNINAALTNDTDLSVLNNAPNGIGISNYMSNAKPNVYDSKDIYDTNSAQIVDHSGNNSASGNVIALASGKNTYGSMWSTDKSFDIKKEQTISAWLYFGSGDGSSDVNSEGITFVLQNDSNGISALGAGLEGIGVYGYDASRVELIGGTGAKQDYIKNTAIQNSVALEFDTDKNNFYNSSNKPLNNNGVSFPSAYRYFTLNGFDTQFGTSTSNLTALGFPDTARYGSGGTYGHIALTYPGLADSYQSGDISGYSNFLPFKTGFGLVHISPQANYLIDAYDEDNNPVYWHHVTIKWTPAAEGSNDATLTYYFNDKNLDYSDNTATKGDYKPTTDTIKVDTSKLNTTDGKVRWGFTAANGPSDSVASKLVALDSIPDLLYADADASITDTTLNKTINADSTDKTVANGDKLALNYQLNYLQGNVNWEDIAAKIKIPDHVTLTPDSDGNVAYITYADGTKEAISQSELTDQTLQHTLAKTLGNKTGSAGTTAKITISATANNDTTSDINVDKAVATFTGSNQISSTNSPEFTILAPKQYTLNLSNDNSNIDLLYKSDNATLNLENTLTYSDNHSFGDDTATTNVIYQITAESKTYNVGATASGNSFKQTIDLKSLINDDDFWNLFTLNSTQKVTVKAIDQANGLISNTVTYNVTTKPNKMLSLEVSKSLQFQDVNYGDTTQYLSRKNNFDLSVTSLRSPWQLTVTTNGLYSNGETLNDNLALVYRQYNDDDFTTLSDEPTVIDQEDTSHDTNVTENIADEWTKNTGLLLKQLNVSPAGQYTGTLTWNVAESLPNE